jgi:hypothetical protein
MSGPGYRSVHGGSNEPWTLPNLGLDYYIVVQRSFRYAKQEFGSKACSVSTDYLSV